MNTPLSFQNYPLFIKTVPTENELKFYYTVHTSLDVVEEKISSVGKNTSDLRELYLGLLYPTEDYKVYPFCCNHSKDPALWDLRGWAKLNFAPLLQIHIGILCTWSFRSFYPHLGHGNVVGGQCCKAPELLFFTDFLCF